MNEKKPWSSDFWKRRIRQRDIDCIFVEDHGLGGRWTSTHLVLKNKTVYCSQVKNNPIIIKGRWQ